MGLGCPLGNAAALSTCREHLEAPQCALDPKALSFLCPGGDILQPFIKTEISYRFFFPVIFSEKSFIGNGG